MRSCVLGVVLGLGAVCGPAQAAYSVAAGHADDDYAALATVLFRMAGVK